MFRLKYNNIDWIDTAIKNASQWKHFLMTQRI